MLCPTCRDSARQGFVEEIMKDIFEVIDVNDSNKSTDFHKDSA
jgi:hypothetical protein